LEEGKIVDRKLKFDLGILHGMSIRPRERRFVHLGNKAGQRKGELP
jgi:hypothetical protein